MLDLKYWQVLGFTHVLRNHLFHLNLDHCTGLVCNCLSTAFPREPVSKLVKSQGGIWGFHSCKWISATTCFPCRSRWHCFEDKGRARSRLPLTRKWSFWKVATEYGPPNHPSPLHPFSSSFSFSLSTPSSSSLRPLLLLSSVKLRDSTLACKKSFF